MTINNPYGRPEAGHAVGRPPQVFILFNKKSHLQAADNDPIAFRLLYLFKQITKRLCKTKGDLFNIASFGTGNACNHIKSKLVG